MGNMNKKVLGPENINKGSKPIEAGSGCPQCELKKIAKNIKLMGGIEFVMCAWEYVPECLKSLLQPLLWFEKR